MPDKPLTLVVDATIAPLEKQMKAAKRLISDLSLDTGQLVDKINTELAKIGPAGDLNKIKAMTSAQNAYVASVEKGARIQSAAFATGTAKGAAEAAAALQRLVDEQDAIIAKARTFVAATEAEELAVKHLAAGAAIARGSLAAQADTMSLQSAMMAKLGINTAATSDVVVAGHQRMGASGMIMQHIVRATGDSFAAGMPPMMIFTEQLGRVGEAVSLMGPGEGALGKFGAFMAGGWGIALIGGVTVLGALISHLDLFSNKLAEAEKKLKDSAEAERLSAQAQVAYDATLDGTIAKVDKLNKELERQIGNQDTINQQQLTQARAAAAQLQGGNPNAKPGGPGEGLASVDHRLAAARKTLQTMKENFGSTDDPGGELAAQGTQEGIIAALETQRAAIVKKIGDATLAIRRAEVPVMGRDAQSHTDPDFAQRRKIEDNQARVNADYAIGKISKGVAQAQLDALQRQLAALGKKDKGDSAGSENALGGMVALLKSLGMIVTHTTDGRHVHGSEHYTGHAIDFVPKGGMGQYSKSEMEQMLTDAGVKFSYGTKRRNGVRQFFGPGDKGHSDHFHVGFTGSPTPESAARAREIAEHRAAAATEKAANEEEAVSAAYAAAAADRMQAMRKGNHSIEEQAKLDRAAVDAKLEEKLVQNSKLKREHFVLDAYEGITANIRKEEITRDEEAAIAVRSLDKQRDLLQLRGALLGIEAQFARTTSERLRIGLEQVENERKGRLVDAAKAYRAIVNPTSEQTDKYNRETSGINQVADATRGLVSKQNQGPTANFKDRLKDDTDNINEALDGVRARGLQSLEDGLVGIISGTESVGTAFKKMAAGILADLARIAVEKLVLSFIPGFSGGTVPGHATGMIPGFAGGIISGPGTGTSDSILAWHQGMGTIRVSNGESIITAEGTRKHRNLLKAINDNTLPSFAEGMVGYPAIPSVGSLRPGIGGGGSITFDLRGAVMTQDLLMQMNRISAAHAQAAVIGGAGLAQQNASEAAMQRLG